MCANPFGGAKIPDAPKPEAPPAPKPDVLLNTGDATKKKRVAAGTKSLQIPLGASSGSGLGIPL